MSTPFDGVDDLMERLGPLSRVAEAARGVVRTTQWKQYATKRWCDTEVGPMQRLVKALEDLEEA